jgi:hypothetical protein
VRKLERFVKFRPRTPLREIIRLMAEQKSGKNEKSCI